MNKLKIEEIEKDLQSQKVLKFKTKSDFKGIKSIIQYACDNGIDNSTYFENGRKQCDRNAKRGIADLYRICRYYLPKTELKEVVDTLSKMNISQSYCCTTNQDVYKLYANNVRHYCDRYNPRIRLKNFKKVQIES